MRHTVCQWLFEHGMRLCTGCDRLLPLKKFGKDKSERHGYYRRCKECTNQKTREQRSKRVQKLKEV